MKICFSSIFLAFFILLQSCQIDKSNTFQENISTDKKDSSDFYLGGIHINESDLERWVNTLDEIGMNTVEVTAYGKQWLWDTDNLEFDKEHGLIEEIRLAEKKGLNTVFITRVQLQHWFEKNHFKWHGMIMPSSDSLLNSWFEKYTEFNVHWAKICEKEGIDIMGIGSEMNALASTIPITELPHLYKYYENKNHQYNHENRIFKYKKELKERHLWVKGKENYKNISAYLDDKISAHHNWSKAVTFRDSTDRIAKLNERRKKIKAHWIHLIKEVRKVYSGKLTYAANYDNYQEVDFWEHLDFIGINAYFPLRKPAKYLPEKEEMLCLFEESWQNIFDTIEHFQQLKNIEDKPIFFTELGYTRVANSTLESWAGQGFSVLGEGPNEQLIVWAEQKEYPTERHLAVKALRKISQKHRVHLNGILYWKLTTEHHLMKEEPFGLYIDSFFPIEEW